MATARPVQLFGALLILFSSSCTELSRRDAPSLGNPPAGAVSEFRVFLDQAWDEDLELHPLTASYVGVTEYQGSWNSLDEEFLNRERVRMQRRLTRLASFDRELLDPQEQLSFDLYKLDLERRLASDNFRLHQFVIQPHQGPHTEVPAALINVHRVSDLADARDYISRLRNVDAFLDGATEQIDRRTSAGFRLADWQYPLMIATAREVVTGAPFSDGNDSVIWRDFKAKVDALAVSGAQKKLLKDQARRALLTKLNPAYERLIASLERQAEGAPDVAGIWRLPDGDQFYEQRLRWHTTTDLDANQIHEIGLREVARVRQEMGALIADLEFAGELQDFFSFLRDDPQFYLRNNTEDRQIYLNGAQALIDDVYRALPGAFGKLPTAEIVVRRLEPFRERSAGRVLYSLPSADGSRPGIYYVSLYEMSSMPVYQMAALAFHQGLPGRHLQSAVSIEQTELPSFQKYTSFSAYTEGWGLYSETLAGELGLYRDPYSEFGHLVSELWRACHLVVDTGIHSQRWSREKALAYLLSNSPNSKVDAMKAVERYLVLPGQSTSSLIGKLKIMELREKARDALGDEFDLRDFHDAVLEDGPVPLAILEAKIDSLIESVQLESF